MEEKTIELHWEETSFKIKINEIVKIYKLDENSSAVEIINEQTFIVNESVEEISKEITYANYEPEFDLLKRMQVDGYREETDRELAERLALACTLLGERLDPSVINTSNKERPYGFFARRAARLAGEVLNRVKI